MFRRDMRGTLEQLTNQHFKDGPVFNKKPRFCPLWFWNWCVTLVCDANFLMRYRIHIKNNPIVDPLDEAITNNREDLIKA